MKHLFRLGIGTIIFYILVVLIVVVVGINSYINGSNLTVGATIFILTVLLLCIAYYLPRVIYIHKDCIELKMVVRRIRIDKSDILQVRRVTREELKGTVRCFGVGSIPFGKNDLWSGGHFYNPAFKKFEMYITSYNQLILIETKGGKRYVTNYVGDPNLMMK